MQEAYRRDDYINATIYSMNIPFSFFKICSNIALTPAPMSSKWFVPEDFLIKEMKAFLTFPLRSKSKDVYNI